MWVVFSGVGDGERQHDSRRPGAQEPGALASADFWMEMIWEESVCQHGVDLRVSTPSPPTPSVDQWQC